MSAVFPFGGPPFKFAVQAAKLISPKLCLAGCLCNKEEWGCGGGGGGGGLFLTLVCFSSLMSINLILPKVGYDY